MPKFVDLLIPATLLVAVALYAAGVAKTMTEPVACEEPDALYAAAAINARGTIDRLWGMTQASANSPEPQTRRIFDKHPPVWFYAIAWLQRCVGDYALAARLLSLSCVLLSACLLFVLSGWVFQAQKKPWTLASLVLTFYLICPVTVKASVIIDNDNSVFTLAFLLFQTAFVYFLRRRGWSLAPVAVAWVLCLFVKVTASVVALGTVLLFCLLRPKRLSIVEIGMLFFVLAGGFLGARHAFVLLGWPADIIFPFPLYVLTQRTVDFPLPFIVQRVGTSILLSILWIGPALIALYLWGLRGLRERFTKQDQDVLIYLALAALVFVFGHMVVGGTHYQFPRYMTPGIPALCLLAVWPFARHRVDFSRVRPWGWLAILAACTLWYRFAAGDYLWTAIFESRQALLGRQAMTLLDVADKGVLQGLAYVVPLVVLIFRAQAGGLRRGMVYLLPVVLAGLVAMQWVQGTAPYATTYNYGEDKRWEAIDLAKSLPADKAIMAPYPFIYFRGDDVSAYGYDRAQFTARYLKGKAKDPRLQGIFYGDMDYPVAVIRQDLEGPDVVAALRARGFEHRRVGSHTAWIRQESSKD